MRRKTLGAIVVFASVLAGCGGGDGSTGVGDDEPVVEIVSEGGFLPVEMALNNGPRYTLLGDGRLLHQGVVTMEFPGRLVPPYLVATLDSNQMNAVMAMIEDIGLPSIDDEVDDRAAGSVADASTDVITYWDDSGEHRLAVYALGLEESRSERNDAFLELVTTFDRFVAGTEADPYQPEQARILAGTGAVAAEFADIRPWPLESDDFSEWTELSNGWYCMAVDGEVLVTFDTATTATTWEHPDAISEPLVLLARPLLPGEPDCPV